MGRRNQHGAVGRNTFDMYFWNSYAITNHYFGGVREGKGKAEVGSSELRCERRLPWAECPIGKREPLVACFGHGR
jgi:hypothetical protein